MHSKAGDTRAVLLIGVLFFLFGFVTWLNGSLIPFLKVLCDLSDTQALFVTFAFYIAYTVMAYPVSFVLEKTGYKKGMMLGLFVMGVGSLLFIPAALSGEFVVFLAALFVLGGGLTLLQSASNPYIVLLGPIESAARRISLMGLLNKLAGVAAPVVFTALVLRGIPAVREILEKEALSQQLILPYGVMSGLLFLLGVFVRYSGLQEIKPAAMEGDVEGMGIFSFPHVLLGALALFFYVGIEVIAGDTIGLYAQSLGLAESSSFTSYTMAFMVLGYLVGIVAIPRFVSQRSALKFSAVLGMVLVVSLFALSDKSYMISTVLWGWSSFDVIPDTVLLVAMLGLANALVWPSIWPLVLEGLGKYTPKASALLILSIAGGALLPLLFAQVAAVSGSMKVAYVSVGLVCYWFVFMYAHSWYKAGKD